MIEELVGSKAKVEEGVRDVLADNRGLTASLDMMGRECERLRGEVRRLKEQMQQQQMTLALGKGP